MRHAVGAVSSRVIRDTHKVTAQQITFHHKSEP